MTTGPLAEAALARRPATARAGAPAGAAGRRACAIVALAAVAAALAAAGVGRHDLVNAGGWPEAAAFFAAAAQPRLDGAFLALTWNAALTTLAYAVLGTALSVAVGAVGGVLVSETWWRGGRSGRRASWLAPWLGVRALLALPRGVHEVVWGLLLLSVLGLDPLVAMLAIAIPFGAVTAKVFAEILDEAPQAPLRALLAAGARRPVAMAYGLLPAALGDLVSYAFYRFECAIRAAAILGLVGAGGLGFQIALSFQALHYDEMWTLLYALIALSGLADWWSAAVRGGRGRAGRAGRAGRWLRPASVLVAAALVPLAWWQVGLAPATAWSPRSRALLDELASAAWPPRLDPTGAGELARLSLETLAMAVIALAISFTGATVLAFAAARGRGTAAARRAGGAGTGARRGAAAARILLVRAGLLVLRAIPPPVWAFVCLLVLFPGVLPGAIALGIYNLGVLGRLMAEAAKHPDGRPEAALRALGAGGAAAFAYGVLPAAFGRFVAYGLYRWEVVVRETVIVGVVGAGGLGLLLDQQLARFDYAAVLSTLLVLIALTLLADLLSAAARRALR